MIACRVRLFKLKTTMHFTYAKKYTQKSEIDNLGNKCVPKDHVHNLQLQLAGGQNMFWCHAIACCERLFNMKTTVYYTYAKFDTLTPEIKDLGKLFTIWSVFIIRD